jgi:hypothetical protein
VRAPISMHACKRRRGAGGRARWHSKRPRPGSLKAFAVAGDDVCPIGRLTLARRGRAAVRLAPTSAAGCQFVSPQMAMLSPASMTLNNDVVAKAVRMSCSSGASSGKQPTPVTSLTVPSADTVRIWKGDVRPAG